MAYSKRTGTSKRYEELCRIHIIPSVGNIRLAHLGVSDVQRMIREAMALGVSPRIASHCRSVLRAALTAAVQDGLLPRNVAALAAPPNVPEVEYMDITPAVARQVMAAVQEDIYEALYMMLLGTGLRLG